MNKTEFSIGYEMAKELRALAVQHAPGAVVELSISKLELAKGVNSDIALLLPMSKLGSTGLRKTFNAFASAAGLPNPRTNAKKTDESRNPYGVRFTDAETEAIDRKAQEAGMNRHGFIRIATLVLAGVSDLPEQLKRLER